MLTSATKRKIDNARDILVGKIPMPTTQVEQITLALIYKFMSDIDKKSKALGDTSGFFANGYEKYAWDNLMDKSLPARDRVTLYSEGLEKMSKNPHIPQLFRDIFKNAFLPFRSPETLKLFLEQIDEFQYDHSEELGNAFEYLLSVMGSQGDAGQFRTPRHIIDFIVKVVDPSKTDTILDPACGTAGFLISAYKHIREKGLTAEEQKKLTDNFVGYDISHDMQRLAMVNMYLHHFPDPKIFEYDTLSSEERWDDDFDVILANPPFMTPTGGIRPHSRFSVHSKRAELLFLDYILEHINSVGKGAVIIPEGILEKQDNASNDLRKLMMEDNALWAVASLPNGIFNPYSDVKTSVLFFDRRIARKKDNIIFIEINNDGYSLGSQRKEISKNDIPLAQKELLAYKSSENKSFISDNEFAHIIKKDLITKSSDYNLNYKKYELLDVINTSKWPMVELQEIASFQNGHAFYKDGYEEEGFFVFDLFNVSEDGNLQFSEKDKFISKDIYEKNAKFHLRKNDIVIIMTDMSKQMKILGRTAVIDKDNYYILNQRVGLLRPINEKVHYKYLHLITNTEYFLSQLKRVAKGSAQKYVNTNEIKSAKIPLPPIDIQKKLVDSFEVKSRKIEEFKSGVAKLKKEIDEEIFKFWN